MRLPLAIIISFLLTISAGHAEQEKTDNQTAAARSLIPEMQLGRHEYAHLNPGRPAIAPRALLPDWHAMKARLAEQHGITFSFAYSALYQRASDTAFGGLAGTRELRELYDFLDLTAPSPGLQNEAAGGIAELYGKWTFIRAGHRTPDISHSDLKTGIG